MQRVPARENRRGTVVRIGVGERADALHRIRRIGEPRVGAVGAVMIEAAVVAVMGSAVGVAMGWTSAQIINWHYRGVYRTPLTFALVTPEIVAFAVALSLLLGLVAGFFAAQRLVRSPALELLTGRRETRRPFAESEAS